MAVRPMLLSRKIGSKETRGASPDSDPDSFFGFTGERVMTEDIIDFSVMFRTLGGIEVTRIIHFLVVDQHVAYNAMISRPTLNR